VWPQRLVFCLACWSIVVTDPEAGTGRTPGLLASTQRLLATLLEILQTRLEIVVTEFEEERERLRELVVFGFLSLFFASLGLIFLTLFVVTLYWETYRLNVLAGFAVLYLVLGIAAGIILRRRLKSRPRLFAATLSEIAQDRDSLTRE
jgi:uncharacterized membrane protein YqjE